MADICCDVVTKAEPSVDRSSRAARRRRLRMAIGRCKLVAEVDAAEEMGGKRRRSGDAGVLVAKEPARYGMVSVCGRRRDMEDTVSIRLDFVQRACGAAAGGSHHFFGVYDGHGCSHVAVLCRDWMHKLVAEEVSRVEPDSQSSAEWTELMQRSFSRMDAAVAAAPSSGRPTPCCRCELQEPRCDNVGSTAIVAIVGSAHIVVANCGDSRAVICRGGAAVPLSSDHKPDRPDELNRIEAAGGRVIYWEGARVLGVLAMSRAIGDGYLKPYVTAEPEVTVTERREEDELLILGSDGLWDVVSNEAACDVARMCLRAKGDDDEDGDAGGRRDRACSTAAALLTKLALSRQSADNVSVVVVDLKNT
ncbi:hypothetical protein Cni_G09418 [Canna indica]|uniref:protein-serine/threonine phosphatase n=1 Tax=Canna indica TaxID=4628 RepID=A0AAQ3Q9L8_9LILI|nr:hypothetical protein Cni_G09418 [Canna indica]